MVTTNENLGLFFRMDFAASTDQQLVEYLDSIGSLVEHYSLEKFNCENELIGRMVADESTARYGPELPDGTPEFIVDLKDVGGKYDRPQFRQFAEIFTPQEYEECYVPAKTKVVEVSEEWKTSTVKKYAKKHGAKASRIVDSAYIPGRLTVAVRWMKEGGEIDTDRSS